MATIDVGVYNISWSLNQKLKLMVEAPGYVIYSNTPLTRKLIGLEVWMRIGAEYSTLNDEYIL